MNPKEDPLTIRQAHALQQTGEDHISVEQVNTETNKAPGPGVIAPIMLRLWDPKLHTSHQLVPEDTSDTQCMENWKNKNHLHPETSETEEQKDK